MPLSNEQWNAPSGGGDFYSHQIANSCRFKSASSDSLSLTFGTSTDLSKFTFSCWVKRSLTHSNGGNTNWQNIIGRGTTIAGGGAAFGFESGGGTSGGLNNRDRIAWYGLAGDGGGSTGGDDRIAGYYYDTSAWYHIIVRVDTSLSAATKIRYYVNGDLKVRTSTNEPTGDMSRFNTAAAHFIGADVNGAFDLDAYLAEVVFCDGQSLGPDSFGETKNGVWIPSDPSGLTFGNNGFYLKFADSSALGTDSSGNDNDWTVVNLTAHDQMKDTPTFGSDNGGNFATLGPLFRTSNIVYGEGNLAWSGSANERGMMSNWAIPIGTKAYFEYYASAWAGSENDTQILGVNQGHAALIGGDRGGDETAYSYRSNGYKAILTTKSVYGSEVQWGTGSIISCAVDRVNHTINFAKNNSYQGTFAISADYDLYPYVGNGGGTSVAGGYINFGADGTFAGTKTAGGNADDNGYGNFIYAPPSGFLAMCSGNVPVAEEVDPAETDDDFPQKLFNTVLHTGSGAEKAIAVGFQPDWSWIKERGAAGDHKLTDSSRGVTKSLEINTTTAEATEAQGVKAFTSTGITLGTDVAYNNNTDTYVSWNWRVNGGTTATNENGSIDTTVQVNAAAGISIVTWTGSGSAATLGHGLGATPAFVVGKSRTASADLMDWPAMHKNMNGGALGVDNSRIYFNSPDAYSTGTLWVPSQNSSTVFGSSGANTNDGSKNHVAYCFAEVEGFSKFGYYEGNGNADGAFVYTGFSPALVICKSVDSGSDWQMFDNKRLGANSTNNELQTNESDAEVATLMIDLLSNGFKCRIATDPNVAETYVYLAWASNPFKYATAR